MIVEKLRQVHVYHPALAGSVCQIPLERPRAETPTCLGDHDPPDRLWLVAAFAQPLARQKLLSLTQSSALHPWSMGLLWPRLTPEGTSRRLTATVALAAYPQASPGNAHPPSRLCPPHLRNHLPLRYRTLEIFASSSGGYASYAVPVRRASVLPSASFPPHLAVTQLPFS